jgi:MFS family permease
MALAIYIVSYGMSTVFGVFLKPLALEFGWSRGMTSSAYSINQITFGIFALVSGALSDRYGVRKVLLINGAIYGAGFMLISRTTSIWHLYLFYGVIVGMGYGSLTVPSVASVTRWFEKRRGIAVGITQSGLGGGTLILSPLAAYLIYSHGWRSSYIIFGLITLAVVIPASIFFRDRPSDLGLKAYGADEATEDNTEHHAGDTVERIKGRESVRTRPFWFINTIHCADCICHSIILVHMVAYLTDIGFSPATAASVLGVAGASAAAGTIVSGALIDRMGGRTALRAALICQVITVSLLMFAHDLWLMYVIAVFFGMGLGGLVTPYPVLTREYFSESAAGTIYGAQLTSATAGMALGGFLGGYLFDISGDYGISFTVSLSAGLVALFFGFILRDPAREARVVAALQPE